MLRGPAYTKIPNPPKSGNEKEPRSRSASRRSRTDEQGKTFPEPCPVQAFVFGGQFEKVTKDEVMRKTEHILAEILVEENRGSMHDAGKQRFFAGNVIGERFVEWTFHGLKASCVSSHCCWRQDCSLTVDQVC